MSHRFGLCLLCAALPAAAQVNERLERSEYTVWANAQPTLAQAISAASPIKIDGKTYHGYTRWRIDWSFTWNPLADGRCQIDQVTTKLYGHITLPALFLASSDQQQRFDTYLKALNQHELGHYAIGQSAAQRIDQQLAKLPTQPDCTSLERTANKLGHDILQDATEQGKRYDQDTEYGKTQGAYLSAP